MSVREEVDKALSSRGRLDGGDIEQETPVVQNVAAAVQELAAAVRILADRFDERAAD